MDDPAAPQFFSSGGWTFAVSRSNERYLRFMKATRFLSYHAHL